MDRQSLPLVAWAGVLALLVAYLSGAAAKSGHYLPGEQALLEAMGQLVYRSKPGWNGSLSSVSRQDVLIVQLALFLCTASQAWLMAIRSAFASTLPLRQTTAIVLVGSALLRLECVRMEPPLETDYHRYLWDGAVTASGRDPYAYAPAEVEDAVRGKDLERYRPGDLERLEPLARLARTPSLLEHVRKINHPAIPTIYPPAAQALFAAAGALAPGNVVALKGLVATIDFGVVCLIALLAGRLGLDPRWAIGYGWCPLVLKEYAATGHYDPLASLFVLLALFWAVARKPMASGLALGAGALAKLYPLLLVPVLAPRLGKRGFAVAAAAFLAGYGPFMRSGSRLFEGLLAFGSTWEFNSSFVALADALVTPLYRPSGPLGLDAFSVAKLLAAALLLVTLALASPRRDPGDLGLVARSGIVLAALVVFSPVADPWYCCWVAPFACFFPSAAAAWLAWGMGLHYFYFLTWSYPVWARPLEYVPAFGLLAWDVARWRR